MRRMLALFLAAASVDCGGLEPRETLEPVAIDEGDEATAIDEARSPAPEEDSAHSAASTGSPCPDSFGAPPGASPCDGARTTCEYAEGTCECVTRAYCRGVPYGPDYQPEWEYRCTPKVRPDGCPGRAPTDESPCEGELRCAYHPDCCGVGTRSSCENGRWSSEQFHVSCPPSRPSRI